VQTLTEVSRVRANRDIPEMESAAVQVIEYTSAEYRTLECTLRIYKVTF